MAPQMSPSRGTLVQGLLEASRPHDVSLSMSMGCQCPSFVMNVAPSTQSHKPSTALSVEQRDYNLCVIYVHVCTRVFAYVCLCVYMCVHVCVHVCACVFICVCMCVYVYTYVYMCAHVHVHVCTCVCMCVHVCLYMCTCVCMYICLC